MRNKLMVLILSLALVTSFGGIMIASEDGLGFSQTLGASYATLNVGPFTGSLSLADFGKNSHTNHARLGLSIPACCSNIYTGGTARFDFENGTMGFHDMNIFAGYEFDIDPVILKFEFGPRINSSTKFYNLHTYEWGLSFRLLFNPLDTLEMYACGKDPCQNSSGG